MVRPLVMQGKAAPEGELGAGLLGVAPGRPKPTEPPVWKPAFADQPPRGGMWTVSSLVCVDGNLR